MEVLNIGFCNKITASCFGYICKKLTLLKILDLTFLNLLSQEISLSKAFTNLSQITQLRLGCCDWVTDATLDIITRSCPKLLVLNLCFSRKVSDNGLCHVCRLQYLCELYLNGLPVTDVGVTMLAHHLHQLDKLDLNFCDNISDNSMVELAEWCSNLKILKLSGLTVTDATIQPFYNSVDKRTMVLTLKVWDVYVLSELKSKIKKELQHPLLSIEYH